MEFLNKVGKLLKTKTFWVNALMFTLILMPRLAELPKYTLSPETTSFIVFVVNAILRWVTKKPLEER